MASLIQLSGDTKTKTFRNVLVLAVSVLVIAGVSYAAGYLKAASSCKSIDVTRAEKSLGFSQDATRETSAFNVAQQKKIAELQQELEEVSHACMPQEMPSGLIDLLNE